MIGGRGPGNTGTSAARLYDPKANAWTTLKTPAPYAVIGPTAGFWDGRVYLTNGYRTAPAPAGGTAVGWYGTVRGI